MSRDKNTAKRLYQIRGEASKRKVKAAKSRSGGESKPGYKQVSFCPECERPSPTTVGNATKAECKLGHKWRVV